MTENFPVFKVAVINDGIDKGRYANAVLVDRDQGLFVTNAHVVDPYGKPDSTEHHIYLPHAKKWCSAQAVPGRINWKADLACLQLSDDLAPYRAAELKTENFGDYAPTKIVSYVRDGMTPETIRSYVFEWTSGYGITLPSILQMQRVREQRNPSNQDLLKLYKNFIWISTKNRELVPSMSGSPIFDEENRLAGILSLSAGTTGLAIPAFEIAALKSNEYDPVTSLGRRPWWAYSPGSIPPV